MTAYGQHTPRVLHALRIRVRRAWMALRTRAGCDRNRPRESGTGACGGAGWRLRSLEPAQMLWYTLRLSIASPLQPMATEGLRARKKARTRQLIANCAAQLFAER